MLELICVADVSYYSWYFFWERKKAHNINLLADDRPVGGGDSQSGVQGSKLYVLSSEHKEHNFFWSALRPSRVKFA